MEMDIGGKPRPPSHIPLNFAVSLKNKKGKGRLNDLFYLYWAFSPGNSTLIKTPESGIFKMGSAFFTF